MRTNIKSYGLGGLLLTTLALGCDGLGGEPSQPLSQRLQALDSDLSLGATGEQVRTLNEFLSERGYYPNAELAAKYPAWRAVAEAPDDPSVFDERTRQAVLHLQANLGQSPTGTVDAALRRSVSGTFCGVPDNLPRFDERNKFALWGGQQFARGHVSWRLMNNDDADLSAARTMDVLRQAFQFWSLAGSGVIFDEKTNTQAANITLSFADLGSVSTAASANADDNTIKFNSRVAWRDVEGPSDLYETAMHEIGHVIGFGHSPWTDTSMYPSLQARRKWSVDDLVAASSVYDTYVQMPGSLAMDVGMSRNDDIWIVSRTATSGGNNRVRKWNGYANTFVDTTDLSEGVRVAVEADGTPWVVKANGDIFRRTSSSTGAASWVKKTNAKATDIGIGFNGDVWIADRTPVSGGFRICKFDGGSNFVCSNGGGVKVSVSASGKPWIVTASGEVIRRKTNSATSGAWESLGAKVVDVAVGEERPALPGTSIPDPIAYAWSIANKSSTAINVAAFAEQPFVNFGSQPSNVGYAKGWVPGTAITGNISSVGPNLAIAMGGSTMPVVINNMGDVFRSPF